MELYSAVSKNNIEKVRKLLENENININYVNENWTSLHLGCYYGLTEIVKLLLTYNNINVNVVDSSGSTPFLVACQTGRTEIVIHMLQDIRVDVNLADIYSWTPLMRACDSGKTQIVEELIKSDRVELFVKTTKDLGSFESGSTAMDIARQEGKDIVKIIEDEINKRKTEKDENENKLRQACQEGNEEAVEQLLSLEVSINLADENGITPLFIAAEKGHSAIVESLLKHKDINTNAQTLRWLTALSIASSNGNKQVVSILLKDPRVNVNLGDRDGWTPLLHACYKGNKEVIEELLKDPKVDLFVKTTKDSFEIKAGSNALGFVTRQNGKEETTSIFSQHFNKQDEMGQSQFYHYCQEGNEEVVRQLLLLDISVNLVDKNGLTPLFIASEKTQLKILELLLQDGRADINLVNKRGWTPLIHACYKGNKEVIEALVKDPRVDLFVKTTKDSFEIKTGSTALDVAKDRGNQEIIQLLESLSNYPLFDAVMKFDIQEIQELLKNPSLDIDKGRGGIPPFILACMRGSKEIVRLFLDDERVRIDKTFLSQQFRNGTLIYKQGSTPLDVVKLNGFDELTILLEYNSCDFSSTPIPCLSTAVRYHYSNYISRTDFSPENVYSPLVLFLSMIIFVMVFIILKQKNYSGNAV